MPTIKTWQQDDICVIEFDGKLTIQEGGDVQLRKAVESALEHGLKKIVLDLRGARAVDSSGLGELIRAKSSVRDSGGQIVLTGVNDKVQDVLEMTRLIGVFKEFDSAEDAMMEIANL